MTTIKTLLHYFEKQPFILCNEIIIHLLKLCLFIHEVGISWIWCHFTMLLKHFIIHKTFVGIKFFNIIKRTCFLLIKPSPHLFKFIMGFYIFHKKGHICLSFRCTCIKSFKVHVPCMMLLIVILNIFNDYNTSNFVIMVQRKIVHVIIM